MKRSTQLVLVAATLTALASQPATAAVRKKPPAPKPITHTFYLHGVSSNGNMDVNTGDTDYLAMDATKPTGAEAKEFASFGTAASPNTQCGSGPLLPTWVGTATGTATGKITVNFFARATSGNLRVRVLNVAGGGCNADFPGAVAETTVPAPVGASAVAVKAEMTLSKPLKLTGALTVQIFEDPTGGVAGISYDSAAAASSVTFTCLPKVASKKSC